MLNTVATLRQNVAALLTGIDLDQVADLYGSFKRAVSTFIQKADVLEASGREPIMLYDSVYTYLAPTTMFGGALIDIRPQGIDRQRWDDVEKMPMMRFDQTKHVTPSGYKVTLESRKAEILMRIAQDFARQRITIDSMSELDGWVLSGNGTGLALDNTVYYHQPASLRFNLPIPGTQALLTKTLSNPLDLSDYEGVGVAFLAIYMPNPDPISSVALRLGSSSADYYEITETEGFLGAFYANDFLLIAFDLAGIAATGSPDMGAIDYVRLAVNYTAVAVPNIRMGDLFICLPSPHEILFYSPAVFVAGGGDASSSITDDDDEILFHDSAYNIYVQEAAREVAKNEGGDISSGLLAGIDLVLEGGGKKTGLYDQYRGDNPSEEIRQVGSYYDDSGFGGWGAPDHG